MNPFERQVRERAYFIWESEGRVFGRADDHWLRAEAELWAMPAEAPLFVRPTTADATPSLAPAEILKGKPARARGTAAKAVAVKAAVAGKAAKPRAAKILAAKILASEAPASEAAKAASTKTAAPKVAAKPRPARAAPASSATLH